MAQTIIKLFLTVVFSIAFTSSGLFISKSIIERINSLIRVAASFTNLADFNAKKRWSCDTNYKQLDFKFVPKAQGGRKKSKGSFMAVYGKFNAKETSGKRIPCYEGPKNSHDPPCQALLKNLGVGV
jgi:hypothetical protein